MVIRRFMQLAKMASLGTVLAVSTSASATLFDFDVIYNGTAVSLDTGSDNPIGSVLQVGDSFNYNVQAGGDDFWRVDVANDFFPFLAFTVDESGIRTADMDLRLLLDGVEQFSLLQNGISNAEVHLGTNIVSLLAGLEFDEIVLDFDLLTSDVLNTTIHDYGIGPNFPGGFDDGISYNGASVGVPEPGVLALMGLGLFGLVVSRKREFHS
ncbi:MAG: PEP-CTERM sorting domain-containing protein [Immundisolibacteraceae bacterium]|nr:PEP-CTERM sorting domain-containing protein [Immundisolibacteraceae bacterium]